MEDNHKNTRARDETPMGFKLSHNGRVNARLKYDVPFPMVSADLLPLSAELQGAGADQAVRDFAQSVIKASREISQVKLDPKSAPTCGVLASLIMVMIGGLSLKVSFRQRSNKLRSLSCKYKEN